MVKAEGRVVPAVQAVAEAMAQVARKADAAVKADAPVARNNSF